MSKIVILLLCVFCAFAQENVTVNLLPQPPMTIIPISSTPGPTPKPTNATTTAKPTVPPTNATTTVKPTNATTTVKPTVPPTNATTTVKPTNATTTVKPTNGTTTTPKPTPAPTPTPVGPVALNNFTGNYSGTNRICLMMKLSVQFELLDKDSTKINVTDDVKYNVNCSNNTVESLQIFWGNNNLTFTFLKNNSKFEIQSVVAAVVPPGGNLTTYSHNKPEFSVSTKQSYKCAKEQSLNLTDVDSKTKFAKLHVSNLQYQAFMNTTEAQYDSAWYCDATNTSDVVPVVVGCVLAVLVVLVLVAYLFGRRRCQARGYLSMGMKPAIVADEMFPEGAGPYMEFDEAGGSASLLIDLTANEKAVHADFFNDFDDLYDDDDLQ